MLRRLFPLLCVLLSLPVAAQGPVRLDKDAADDEPDDNNVSIYVRPSPLGNVNFSFYNTSEAFLNLVPKALNCSWVDAERTSHHVRGTCRGWLKPSAGSSSSTSRRCFMTSTMTASAPS